VRLTRDARSWLAAPSQAPQSLSNTYWCASISCLARVTAASLTE
jgi:hypothetical protein